MAKKAVRQATRKPDPLITITKEQSQRYNQKCWHMQKLCEEANSSIFMLVKALSEVRKDDFTKFQTHMRAQEALINKQLDALKECAFDLGLAVGAFSWGKN